MEKDHLEILLEDVRGKFELVLEGHESLNRKIYNRFDELDSKIEHNSFLIGTLNRKIDDVDQRLDKQIQGVEKSLNDKIDRVEKNLNDKIEDLKKVCMPESMVLKIFRAIKSMLLPPNSPHIEQIPRLIMEYIG